VPRKSKSRLRKQTASKRRPAFGTTREFSIHVPRQFRLLPVKAFAKLSLHCATSVRNEPRIADPAATVGVRQTTAPVARCIIFAIYAKRPIQSGANPFESVEIFICNCEIIVTRGI
jgi:hypothetical protein